MPDDGAYVQWLEQLASMRQAIADLQLPEISQDTPTYGNDIDFDYDDFSGTASGEDIWDIISDEYDEYSSDHLDYVQDNPVDVRAYDQQWLAHKCAIVAQHASGLDAKSLKEHILAMLASDSNGKNISLSQTPPVS